MRDLVEISQMLAIPREQNIAFVVGSERQMQSVTKRLPRHDQPLDVGFNNIEYPRFRGQQRNSLQLIQFLRFVRMIAFLEFISHGLAGHDFIIKPH